MADYSNSRWKERGSFSKDTLHSYQDIVDAIRTAPYGIDTREAMAQMLIFLHSTIQSAGKDDIDMSPTDSFGNLSELQQKYPNGSPGVFVVQENGHWYFWNEMERQWKDGGAYQAPIDSDKLLALEEELKIRYEELSKQLDDQKLTDVAETLNRESFDQSVEERIAMLESKTARMKQSVEEIVDPIGITTGIEISSWRPETDTTMTKTGIPADAAKVGQKLTEIKNKTAFDDIKDELHFGSWNFPIIYLDKIPDELLDPMNTKKDEFKGTFSIRIPSKNVIRNLSKVKIQGSSSAHFPKKNYTITFENPVELNVDWGKHKKYVLKSNFNDFSQARNVVNAKIWSKIRNSRINPKRESIGISDKNGNEIVGETLSSLASTKSYGAIDGFPVGVVMNGSWWGLASLTIPKDDWMAGMGKGKHEAILSAGYSDTEANYFKGLPSYIISKSTGRTDFEFEYISDENDDQWVKDKLEALIKVTMAHYDTDEGYINAISQYLDIDSAIDYFIFTVILANDDGVGNNYLLQTYHEKDVFYFAAYDLDLTLGNRAWQGTLVASDLTGITFESAASLHRLFDVILHHMTSKLISRYEELRNEFLNESYIYENYIRYMTSIPKLLKHQEILRWPQTPATDVKDFGQIMTWYNLRVKRIDNEIKEIKERMENAN